MIFNKPNKRKISILGTEYTIIVERENKNFDKADGYCDESVKEIHIKIHKPDEYNIKNIHYYYKKVLRHEIVHAFFFESGLHDNALDFGGSWSVNEEMVDWIAYQFHKIEKVFRELNIWLKQFLK